MLRSGHTGGTRMEPTGLPESHPPGPFYRAGGVTLGSHQSAACGAADEQRTPQNGGAGVPKKSTRRHPTNLWQKRNNFFAGSGNILQTGPYEVGRSGCLVTPATDGNPVVETLKSKSAHFPGGHVGNPEEPELGQSTTDNPVSNLGSTSGEQERSLRLGKKALLLLLSSTKRFPLLPHGPLTLGDARIVQGEFELLRVSGGGSHGENVSVSREHRNP